jgi:hypothetical protein
MSAVARSDMPEALQYDRVVVLAIAVEDYQNARTAADRQGPLRESRRRGVRRHDQAGL